MKNTSLNTLVNRLRIAILTFILVLIALVLFSFKQSALYGDFLKQLGLSKPDADSKISYGLLHGSIDTYGMRNIKNAMLNDRVALVKDLASYAKQYTRSEAFKKEYALLKQRNKPEDMQKAQTPEEFRASLITNAKVALKETEENVKKAPANIKDIFEKALVNAQKNLKDAEDPNNKYVRNYTKNFETLKKSMKDGYDAQVKSWEEKYPSDPMQYVKPNLQQFLNETDNIDFEAELVTRNGKKYFVNSTYERKGNRWKMAFRAGKPAIEAARSFVTQWLTEL